MPECKTQYCNCCSKNLETEKRLQTWDKKFLRQKSIGRFEVVIYLNCSNSDIRLYERSVM